MGYHIFDTDISYNFIKPIMSLIEYILLCRFETDSTNFIHTLYNYISLEYN